MSLALLTLGKQGPPRWPIVRLVGTRSGRQSCGTAGPYLPRRSALSQPPPMGVHRHARFASRRSPAPPDSSALTQPRRLQRGFLRPTRSEEPAHSRLTPPSKHHQATSDGTGINAERTPHEFIRAAKLLLERQRDFRVDQLKQLDAPPRPLTDAVRKEIGRRLLTAARRRPCRHRCGHCADRAGRLRTLSRLRRPPVARAIGRPPHGPHVQRLPAAPWTAQSRSLPRADGRVPTPMRTDT